MAKKQSLWSARYAGWQMIVEAPRKREAQAIANRCVDRFGGIVGIDVPTIQRATEADIDWYRMMSGCVSNA